MQALYAIMQYNGKLYNVHDILSYFRDFDFDLIFFFLQGTQIDCFFKDVITHATSSYLL